MAENTVEKAIEKLRAEMDKSKKNSSIQRIGEFLIKIVQDNPGASEKILINDKSIVKSLKEMEKVAKKNAIDGSASISDQEGFEIVLKYFEINAAAPEVKPAIKEEPKKEESKAAETDFNYSLDDFLK